MHPAPPKHPHTNARIRNPQPVPHSQRKPTSFDIAYLAGVSQPTVSRALRGSPTVSEETRKRIEAIAQQLNYKVDKNASNLRSQQSNTLALLFFEDPTPDDSMINPFFLSMLGSITRTCANRGYDLLISFQQLSSNWHVDYEDSRKADGVILLGYGDYEEYRARLDQLVAQGTHFVRWGEAGIGPQGSTLGCDNHQGGLEVTRHLVASGRRRIAFVGEANSHYPEFFDRYKGYAAALEEAGLAVEPDLQIGGLNTEDEGHAAVGILREKGVTFDAVFAASDTIAIGVLRALQEAGLSVPGDVAIAGFDDIPAAQLTTPPLTTFRQNAGKAGEMLVDMLLKRVRNEPVENQMLPGELIVRKSTGG